MHIIHTVRFKIAKVLFLIEASSDQLRQAQIETRGGCLGTRLGTPVKHIRAIVASHAGCVEPGASLSERTL